MQISPAVQRRVQESSAQGRLMAELHRHCEEWECLMVLSTIDRAGDVRKVSRAVSVMLDQGPRNRLNCKSNRA
jgi:hypothetical protein